MATPTKESYRLLHEGSITFSEIESNGIRIDTERLDVNLEKTKRKIAKYNRKLKSHKWWRKWQGRFGAKANLDSPTQLDTVLFHELGLPRNEFARNKTDEEALSHLDHFPWIALYRHAKKFKKLYGTYLRGIKRETDQHGILHSTFYFEAITYRSASSDPNLQNIPIRDPLIGKQIRECFVPRDDDHILIDIDMVGAEVRASCCYHHDQRLIDYVLNPQLDMHRDMAAECFKCKKTQVSKWMRYVGKNMFVFPQFYGSWYEECAKNLWQAAKKGMPLEDDGTEALDHLKAEGIFNLGDFTNHLERVEKRFWGKRFARYAEWKREWWALYLKRGWLQMLSGFVCRGIYRKNDAINYPIQGFSFHCILWVMNQVRKELKRRKMKAKLVNQIHDSILGDVPRREADDYIELVCDMITNKLPKHWPQLIVPMEAEVELCEQNWFDKREIKL